MSLREQMSLTGGTRRCLKRQPTHARASGLARAAYQTLKREGSSRPLDRVELERLARLPAEQVRQEIGGLIARILEEDKAPVNDLERRQLTTDIHDEMFGFGPLEALLRDPTVSDILVNTHPHDLRRTRAAVSS